MMEQRSSTDFAAKTRATIYAADELHARMLRTKDSDTFTWYGGIFKQKMVENLLDGGGGVKVLEKKEGDYYNLKC